jgi:3-methyladenine DNA glycosylase AlkD
LNYNQIIKRLKSMKNEKNIAGMARFGINAKSTLGIPIGELRKIGKKAGNDHVLALKLWDSGIHEARILAALVDEPGKVTGLQMEKWAAGFDSWDVCDQVCDNLFVHVKNGYEKAVKWAERSREFVKRAAFTMFAVIAWFRLDMTDAKAAKMLGLIEKHSADGRNYVKKAVNWALRNIGKSGTKYYKAAIVTARRLGRSKYKSARWIAKDAIRELLKPEIIKRAKEREERFNRRSKASKRK